jgi:nucleoid DNA-binding protein
LPHHLLKNDPLQAAAPAAFLYLRNAIRNLDLNKGIAQLLYDHDCVIIPEFGGFIASYRPAQIHKATNTIHPPSKQIGFNKNLVNNDGLVADYFVRHQEVSFDEAMSFINKRVETIKSDLEAGRRVEFREVGAIYKDDTGALQFVPDDNTNYLRESFGLRNVGLKAPVVTAEEPQKATPVVSIAPAKEEPETVERKRSSGWVAAAIAIPLLLTSGWLLGDMWSNGGHLNLATLNPFTPTTITSDFNARFPEEALRFDYEGGNTVENIAHNNPELSSIFFSFTEDQVSPDGIKVILKEEAVVEKTSSLKLYFVVGGAFAEKRNAEKLVDKLRDKGFDASIFGQHKGLNLVCYGSYTNRSAAKTALREVKQNENSNAWLKKH